jgi:hypothetical protein
VDLRQLARDFGPSGIRKLAELAGLVPGIPAKNPTVQVAAIRELLDRGYGKPAQVIEASAQQDITLWHLTAASMVEPLGPVIDGTVPTTDANRPRIVIDLSKPPLE